MKPVRACSEQDTEILDRPANSNTVEAWDFFQAWLRNPLRIAAIAPSGTALAKLITSEISADTGPVIELGPGTGVFSRALIGRGVPQTELALIEFEPKFAVALRTRYPQATVFRMDAARLSSVELFDRRPAGAIVSGLPLLSMSPLQVTKVLTAAFQKMSPGGAFYQFTYGLRCPVPAKVLRRLGLKAVRIGGTLANIPPAAVYRLRKIDQ
ncbi:class I SAM-dependent methyltransferase [Agrobacterium rosae]|uniref:class I SAM-dependent methyltransferase n=1 Tax=Agrobacterium rosae TaxID=1972867 RepID=UPI003BA11A76